NAKFSDTAPQTANAKIVGKYLVMSPLTSANGDVHWSCRQSNVDQQYLPSSCRG
ncbi:MAG TPA: pilin, partial [Gammaproteobacteria bacterium]|nr:pilin [Gammaproteobacteria bacterium]